MDWMNGIDGGGVPVDDEPTDSFYCPYTNRAECALMTKGWQPQELCNAVECDQLRYFRAARKNHKRAA